MKDTKLKPFDVTKQCYACLSFKDLIQTLDYTGKPFYLCKKCIWMDGNI